MTPPLTWRGRLHQTAGDRIGGGSHHRRYRGGRDGEISVRRFISQATGQAGSPWAFYSSRKREVNSTSPVQKGSIWGRWPVAIASS